MANKSGITEQVIGLPKGGGTIPGLGEAFTPDLHTGTGNFAVPIVLPPGRNGLTPELQLRYSSGAPNGSFGLGWYLTVSMMSRFTGAGFPGYHDDDPDLARRDGFLLDGEELVLVGEQRGAGPAGRETRRSYRPGSEQAFRRITRTTGAGRDDWEVVGRDGVRRSFGTTPESRVRTGPPDERVFAWMLTQTADSLGNRIVYRYRRDDGGFDDVAPLAASGHWYEAGREYNQSYLVGIDYLDYRPTGAAADKFLVGVEFDYGQLDDTGEVAGEWDYRGETRSLRIAQASRCVPSGAAAGSWCGFARRVRRRG